MFKTATITKQGQISIPSSFRKKFGLNEEKKVQISIKDDKMIIEPVEDLLGYVGALASKRQKGKSIEEIMRVEKQSARDGFIAKFKSRS